MTGSQAADRPGASGGGARRFFKNAGFIAGAEFVARLKGLILIPLLTHYLGVVDYGAWTQVVILATFVPLLMIMGTDSGLVRYLPGRNLEYQRRHFAGWLVTMLGLAAILSVALFLVKHPVAVVFFGAGEEYERFIPLAAAMIWVNVLVTGIRTWYRLQGNARWFAAITLGQAVFSLVATVALLVLDQTIYEFVVYLLVGDLVLGALLAVAIVRDYGITRPDFSLLPKLLRFGLPLVPAGFAVWGLNWMDRIFLVEYTDLADVGRYSLAYSLGYLAIQLIANPIWTMYPTAAAEHWNREEPESVQHLFERTAGAMLLLIAPIVAGTAVLGPLVLALLAPPSFSSAAPVISLVVAAYLFLMLSAYYETAMGLAFRQWLSTVAVALAFTVNLALNVLLIPPYGILGAAIATMVGFLVQLAFSVTVITRMKVLRTPISGPVRIAVAAAATAACLLPVRELLGDGRPLLALVALSALGALIYGGACVALRLVTVETLRREGGAIVARLRPATRPV